ncbi:MAG: hypothetical protein ACLQDV_20325 [Candidatus Binataceae bacterium]
MPSLRQRSLPMNAMVVVLAMMTLGVVVLHPALRVRHSEYSCRFHSATRGTTRHATLEVSGSKDPPNVIHVCRLMWLGHLSTPVLSRFEREVRGVSPAAVPRIRLLCRLKISIAGSSSPDPFG